MISRCKRGVCKRVLLPAVVLYCLSMLAGAALAADFPALVTLPSLPASDIVDGKLNGYTIGPAPTAHPRPEYSHFYVPPTKFIEVRPGNKSTAVSEHFRLEQFLCKQESEFPKYVVLQPSLLELLERLVDELNRAGFPVETFGVISGYRTPAYNRRIGNVPNSRHLYGDAMDFYVDLDRNGRLDDLNKDGRMDKSDVDFLYELVDTFLRRPENADLVGGLGRYYPNSRHGGYIHVDTRGFLSRW